MATPGFGAAGRSGGAKSSPFDGGRLRYRRTRFRMTPPSSSDPTPPRLPAAGALQCPNCGAALRGAGHAVCLLSGAARDARLPDLFPAPVRGRELLLYTRGTRAARERTFSAKSEGRGRPVLPQADELRRAWGSRLAGGVHACAAACGCRRGASSGCAPIARRSRRSCTAARCADRRGAALTTELRVRYRPCPRCRKLMNRVNFASGAKVVLDICREHGTFFDRDELHRVVTFIQAGGMERARGPRTRGAEGRTGPFARAAGIRAARRRRDGAR